MRTGIIKVQVDVASSLSRIDFIDNTQQTNGPKLISIHSSSIRISNIKKNHDANGQELDCLFRRFHIAFGLFLLTIKYKRYSDSFLINNDLIKINTCMLHTLSFKS